MECAREEKGGEEMYIQLNTIDKVTEFINEIIRYDEDHVRLSSGIFEVDARSLMGVFSLDLSRPIEVKMAKDVSKELQDLILKFKVEKPAA